MCSGKVKFLFEAPTASHAVTKLRTSSRLLAWSFEQKAPSGHQASSTQLRPCRVRDNALIASDFTASPQPDVPRHVPTVSGGDSNVAVPL